MLSQPNIHVLRPSLTPCPSYFHLTSVNSLKTSLEDFDFPFASSWHNSPHLPQIPESKWTSLFSSWSDSWGYTLNYQEIIYSLATMLQVWTSAELVLLTIFSKFWFSSRFSKIVARTRLNWTLSLLIVLPVATGTPISLDFIDYHNRRAKWPWITCDPSQSPNVTCPAESPNWITVPGSVTIYSLTVQGCLWNPLQSLFLQSSVVASFPCFCHC